MRMLTRDNYYSLEADRAYMSCSQYQGFCECEAKQKAILDGRWVDDPGEAFLVGNYFHTALEGAKAHQEFVIEHEDKIFKSRRTKAEQEMGVFPKYAPYEKADQMIACAYNDPLIRSLIDMPGEPEVIMTGELFGVPWKVRLDKYVADGRLIIDWKTCASVSELKWSDEYGGKVTFIDMYGYMMRAAVYSEIEKQVSGESTDPSFIIVAISKEDPPDKEVLLLNHRERYDYELVKIKELLPTFMAIKEGRILPKRCGRCDYCRATKQLYEIKPYYKLMPEFREAREDDWSGTGPGMADTQEAAELADVSAVREPAQVEKDTD